MSENPHTLFGNFRIAVGNFELAKAKAISDLRELQRTASAAPGVELSDEQRKLIAQFTAAAGALDFPAFVRDTATPDFKATQVAA